MNPDRTPKQVGLTYILTGQNRPSKKVGVNRSMLVCEWRRLKLFEFTY